MEEKVVRKLELKDVGQEMEGRIINMMWRTWQYIGEEIVNMSDKGRVSRKGVIETVLDCDFCKTHGEDSFAYEILRCLSSSDQEKLGMKAFQNPWYT